MKKYIASFDCGNDIVDVDIMARNKKEATHKAQVIKNNHFNDRRIKTMVWIPATPLLDLAITWGKLKEVPCPGLCNSIPPAYIGNLKLFAPIDYDFMEKQGYCSVYWGSGIKNASPQDNLFTFTELRQTIMAFLIVMNDEV